MSDLSALVVEGPNATPVMRMVERPLVQPHWALISVIACALDATDTAILAGASAEAARPIVPGRFFVGVVEALGAGLTEDSTGHRLRPGTPVLVPSVIPCGTCALCHDPIRFAPGCLAPVRLGTGLATGTDAATGSTPGTGEEGLLSGGLASAVLVRPGAIHALPLTMPPWIATLAEPFAASLLACARAQAIGRFPHGASVVVIGSDAGALLSVIAALELGAGSVVAVGGPDAPFLRLARQCGAGATIDTTEVTDVAEREAIIRETVGGRGADLVLANAGIPAEGLTCLREGGTLVTMGPGVAASGPIAEKRLTLLGVSGFQPSDIPVALGLLYRARARYPLAAMHARFPFSAGGVAAALTALRDGATPRALITHRPDLAG